METAILETIALRHVYSAGTPFEKTAIGCVDVRINKGELVALIGHTGSGKSTFVQHLNGLLKPTSGQVLYNGTDIFADKKTTHNIRYKVGLVFQYPEYQLFEETVYKDIAFGPKNMKLSDAEIDDCVREAARFVGVGEELFEKSPLELSGGQKRRVAIAGVIAMRPEVLVLDEPTAGLDPKGCDEIINNILEYRKQSGSTVILVTHSMDDAARIADRLIVFSEGGIFMDGSPHEVFSRTEDILRIGLDIPAPTAIAEKLRKLGLPVPEGIYTSEHLKDAVLSIKKGGCTNA
ncbi:MAG: energy-coupling factor transporter ATPase [Ruminococcaceae bacterium]|nr:energy-coupling factor transporter ATPase [Oscillospiraceae bacterium]